MPITMLAWGVSAVSGCSLGCLEKLRTLDKPFGFLVLKPSGTRPTGVSLPTHWAEFINS